MSHVNDGHGHRRPTTRPSVSNRVVVSCMDFFLENMRFHGITDVRIDLFQSVRSTELSFVNYVDVVLYVTAFDSWNNCLYEYGEVVGSSAAAAEELEADDEFLQRGMERMAEVQDQLTGLGYHVEHGRLMQPTSYE